MNESKEVIRRGDAFDIGNAEVTESGQGQDAIINILQNPGQISSMLNLTKKQEANLRSLLVGAGTGGIHRMLSEQLGDVAAGAIGGLLAGFLTQKIMGGKQG